MLLLLQEPHLTTLFELLEMLACFKPPSPSIEKVQENLEVCLYFMNGWMFFITVLTSKQLCVCAECTL